MREQLKPQVANPQQAVQQAIEGSEFPVCLLDFGDNIGGGSSGDSTFVLEELVRQQAEKWCALSGIQRACRPASRLE